MIFFLKKYGKKYGKHYGKNVRGKDSLIGRNSHQLPAAHWQNILPDMASSGDVTSGHVTSGHA
jgi:hypothetical protein